MCKVLRYKVFSIRFQVLCFICKVVSKQLCYKHQIVSGRLLVLGFKYKGFSIKSQVSGFK